jgi:PhoH-like ATPase
MSDVYKSKQTRVFDTNVLLSDPSILESFNNSDLIIPLCVFDELDQHKNRNDHVGLNARTFSRNLMALRSRGNLFQGITLDNGCSLRVATLDPQSLINVPIEFNTNVDNKILLLMVQLRSSGISATLVSRDVNMCLKCDALGMSSEMYVADRQRQVRDESYTGVRSCTFSDSEIADLLTSGVTSINVDDLYPNEIIIVKNSQNQTKAHARVIDKQLHVLQNHQTVYGLKPRNKEQNFSLNLLLDPRVKLITLVGKAGCVDPSTLVTVKLENIDWELPEPVHTYSHVKSEDEE